MKSKPAPAHDGAERFTFRSTLWLYSGKAAWHFITVPKAESDAIRFFASTRKGAWGSVRMKVEVGTTNWHTSLFPESSSGCYLLPVKADVRKKEALVLGQLVEVTVTL